MQISGARHRACFTFEQARVLFTLPTQSQAFFAEQCAGVRALAFIPGPFPQMGGERACVSHKTGGFF